MLFPALTEVLDPTPHSAALNMAIDEVLLRTAREPLLRVYRWERPAVSFGYFGKWAEIAPAWPDRDLVRRWTGGGMVEHGEDVTYTLIVPREHPFFTVSAVDSYCAIHEVLAAWLGKSHPELQLADASAARISSACFDNASQHDVLAAGRKIAGAAQRRTRAGLLHQGSIQPNSNPNGRNVASFGASLSADVRRRELDPSELLQAQRCASEKYAATAWMQRF